MTEERLKRRCSKILPFIAFILKRRNVVIENTKYQLGIVYFNDICADTYFLQTKFYQIQCK